MCLMDWMLRWLNDISGSERAGGYESSWVLALHWSIWVASPLRETILSGSQRGVLQKYLALDIEGMGSEGSDSPA